MLNRLAEFHRLKGNLSKAEQLYRQVLIDFAEIGQEHRAVVRTALGNLTLLHMSQARFASAEKYAELMERELKMAAGPKGKRNETRPVPSAPAGEKGRAPVPSIVRPQPAPSAPPPSRGQNEVAGLMQPPPDAEPAPEQWPRTSDQAAKVDGCPPPEVTAAPISGGRIELRAMRPCRAGQEFEIHYGDMRFQRSFDAKGEAALSFDLFAGDELPFSIKFADADAIKIVLPKSAQPNITKLAIVWDKPVDLDLHAFEYAAPFGKPGHVWSGTSRSLAVTLGLVAAEKRAHGYISMSSRGDGRGTHAEVFTLVHREGQKYGAIAFALDFASRGDQAQAPYCGDDALGAIPYRIIRRSPDGRVTTDKGRIAAVPCGTKLDQTARFMRAAVPDIKLRR